MLAAVEALAAIVLLLHKRYLMVLHTLLRLVLVEPLDQQEILVAMVAILFLTRTPQLAAAVALLLQMPQVQMAALAAAAQELMGPEEQAHQDKETTAGQALLQAAQTFLLLAAGEDQVRSVQQHQTVLAATAGMELPTQ